MKRSSELNSASPEELHKRLRELRHELLKLNAQVATGTVPKNPGQIKKTRKTVARIQTILRAQELGKIAGGKETA